MFSTGQIIFASLFAITFAIIIYLSYRKDKRLHAKSYEGVKWVGIAFLVFVIILIFLKHFLKN